MAGIRHWHGSCCVGDMLRKISRLFTIRTRFEAYAVIYALALGAVGRGIHYLHQYSGVGGWLLFLACTGAVFMAGAKILDATDTRWNGRERRGRERRSLLGEDPSLSKL